MTKILTSVAHPPALPQQSPSNTRRYSVLRSLLIFIIAFFAGWLAARLGASSEIDTTIAVSWGDGKYGKAFYGAYVYLVPNSAGYAVKARVAIGRGDGYWHDCGQIGQAESDAEAVEKWGNVTWSPEGLAIGDPTSGGYFLPRTQLESHR